MKNLPGALMPLAAYVQFMLYKLVPNKKNPLRNDKLPCNVSGEVVSAHDNQHWIDSKTAVSTANLFGDNYGVAFVFTERDPFFFIDIDNCLTNGVWSDHANYLMATFPGAAVEVSQSGSGLHIIGTATGVHEHDCKSKIVAADLYTDLRFVALTGTSIIGDASTVFDLTTFVAQHFPITVAADSAAWTSSPVEGWEGPSDDKRLIAKALKSGGAATLFGGGVTFKDLWTCNTKKLATIYPPDHGGEGYDASRVDAALAQHLAFWTGKDCERTQHLMRQSGLARDKWEKRKDYLRRTIERAMVLQQTVYTPPQSVQPLKKTNEPQLLEGYQFLGAAQQIEYFKGCVYVSDIHKIFTPSGTLLKPEQFNATYGGYSFQLESDSSGKITKKAWEAFTESQAVRYPTADSRCFRPELDPGELIEYDGRSYVNTYVPIVTPSLPGDVGPFLIHLHKILPVPKDQEILLAYMAACVQYKGIKFQWAPLLQGVEGNGKTLFTRCVAAAIGDRYTHMPAASEISEKYNKWLFETLFIGVEDIYVPDQKLQVIEILKPMITSDRMACRAMQADQVMGDVRCNFIFNSNHKDGIRKTRNDRRFSVFYTAQQKNEDLKKCGMVDGYFQKLYKWLREGGNAFVTNFLENYYIPDELNPANLTPAPITSSTNEAIGLGMGVVEQEILEAVGEGRPGFCGGWISSMAVDRLLQAVRRSIPHNKRRELLQALGYDWHQALHNGRVNNIVPLDGGKPRLFIKEGHISANLNSAADVVRVYQEAQRAAPNAGVETAVNIFR